MGTLVNLMNDRVGTASSHSIPVSGGRFSEIEILKIFGDICIAVADLHAHGIIHRDLKIENILIDLPSTYADTPNRNSSAHATNSILNLNFVLCDFGSATKEIYDRRNSIHQNVQLIADEIQK
jgi:serine/threonine protein kinase